jgi:hypothetical protein
LPALPFVRDRADTNYGAALRQLLCREILGIELGEHLLIVAGAARRLDGPLLDPAKTIENIERPAAELAELTVADHVDAGLLLPFHHIGHRIGQASIEGGLLDVNAVVDGLNVSGQFGRAHEAAYVRCEDSIDVYCHNWSRPVS